MKKILWVALGALALLLGNDAVFVQAQQTTPSQLDGCIYNATPPTLSDKQSVIIQCNSNGAVNVSGTISATNPSVATTGAAVPASGTYVAGNKAGNLTGITLDGSSNVNVNCAAGCSGGTFNNNADAVATSATNGQAASWLYGYNGTTWDRLRVDASKNLNVNINAAIAAGTNVIGHVIADTGSTTAVTGNVTVVQPTGTNLHAVLDTTSTTAVTQATAANLNATVIGAGTAGTANAGVLTVQGIASMTKLLVTPDSVALPANQSVNEAQINGVTPLMGNGVSGTGAQRVTIASDSTGQLTLAAGAAVIGHVIADTGSTTAVTQATATNLNAAVVGTGTAGSPAGNILTVQGVASMTKLLVTPDSVALPANQSVNVAQINGVTPLMGNGASGTGAQRVTIASDSTGQITLAAGAATIGALTANQSVNLAQIAGTTTVNGGVAGSQSVGGTVATNVAITANPLNLGAQGVSSENAAVTTARQVQLVADLVGKLIVLPYANPENFVSGVITTAMTGTTSTSLVASPGGSLRNYITQITCSNAHATVGTDIIVQDGSGGTTIYFLPAAAVYGGAALTFPTPLRQPTTATALYVANVTTGASTKCAASGYKGL